MTVSLTRRANAWLFVTPEGDYELTGPIRSRDAALALAALRLWLVVPLEA